MAEATPQQQQPTRGSGCSDGGGARRGAWSLIAKLRELAASGESATAMTRESVAAGNGDGSQGVGHSNSVHAMVCQQ